MRMARAAMKLTTREAGEALGLSAMAVSRYEKGDESVISVATAKRITEWFEGNRIFFGPKDGVCIGQDVFREARWWSSALFQLLRENNIKPSSADVIAAYRRFIDDV